MEKARKLWIAVLLGVLLIGAMVGVAGAGVKNRTSGALGPTAYITIPGAAFNPIQDGANWYNAGSCIRNDSVGPLFLLAGPIVFAHPGAVKITEVALRAYDNNPGADACVGLKRNAFGTGFEQGMASACSSGSADELRTFAAPSISPDTVNPQNHGCYVRLLLEEGTELRVYAVRIAYRPVL